VTLANHNVTMLVKEREKRHTLRRPLWLFKFQIKMVNATLWLC